MQQRIKLKPKQLAQITQIQAQKKQVNDMFVELSQRETALLEIILEGENIDPKIVSGVKLENGELILGIIEKKEPRKKLK